jgi:dTDP-4-dehydrorhamnose reductase
MLNVLITGADGQVAWDLLRQANPAKVTVIAFNKNKLDITNALLVNQTIEALKPDLVINLAAYTQVDQAEDDILRAFAVNRDGAKNLAIACEKIHCSLLHVSTDYVFDGEGNRPYLETSTANPLSVYGKSKWEGEEAIRQHCKQHIILRMSAVFGFCGQNFVKTMLRLAQTKEVLHVVSDQITCPTAAADIAKVLWELAEKNQAEETCGTYHFCGSNPVSWHEFATTIISQGKKHFTLQTRQIEAIPASAYPTRAKRPNYSVLNCQQLETDFNIRQACWEDSLAQVLTELHCNAGFHEKRSTQPT